MDSGIYLYIYSTFVLVLLLKSGLYHIIKDYDISVIFYTLNNSNTIARLNFLKCVYIYRFQASNIFAWYACLC